MALFPLNVITELEVNGTWRDISRYVMQRDGVVITGGSTATGDTAQPGTCALTLKNTDGRFSPGYTLGMFYPYLVRNMQIRVSVNDTSSSGNNYNGFRFWGEVPDWPPQQGDDLGGRDVFVQIVATGPLRRIQTGGGEGSALQRYYQTLTGLYAPVAYWPCEEDPNTGLIGTGVQGGSNMSVVSGTPKFKAVSNFNGSRPIGVVNGSTWTGVTSSFGSSGDDLFLSAGTYQWIASTTTVDTRVWGAGGGGSKGSEGNSGGSGGGGGAYARNSAVAVTPGQQYTVVVGAGGGPDTYAGGGDDGNASSFTGDAVTVTGNPGQGSNANGGSGAAGGTSSGAATSNFVGGAGGGAAGFNQGGGGGGSAGTAAAGNAGGNASLGSPGSGGSAVTGGGTGGAGGGFSPQRDGSDGTSPGAAGGGGWANASSHTFGGAGAPGKVELIYTASGGGTKPSNNVLRFIMFVPVHGGNSGSVMVRMVGSGTVARLDVQYISGSGGQIRLLGYNSGSSQIFDSGSLDVNADGQTLMVSAELAVSGSNVAWALSAIVPGAQGVVNKTSGTLTTATMGSASQVIVAPNGDISKTAIGHISIQYALIPLWKESMALNGHTTEAGIDRFIRLGTEEAIGTIAQYNEGADHWGFESGTQSWTATNGSVTSSTVTNSNGWPTELTHSLLLTANGSGSPSTTAPSGTSGQPIALGFFDVVSLSIDLFCPVQLPSVYIGLRWYTTGGVLISESDTADVILPANQPTTFRLVGAAAQAPATAAFFAPTFGDHHTDAASTLLYGDNVRISPHMGTQTAKEYAAFLEEIQTIDQGLLKEAKTLWGLGYRTRIKLINQTPAVTLDYAQKQLTMPLAPVVDVQNVKNDITVHRHKGSKVQVTLASGTMSILEPPSGTGRHKKTLKAIAAADEQLVALASHLLLLGTVSDERYPTITVNLGRCTRVGDTLAPLMSAVAGVEIGDVVQLNNLPFWYPSTTTKQMVIGYAETLNAYEWTVTWNCQPYTPYVQATTSIRHW